MSGNSFDYDVIVIGSGFGGSVAALRATEKGYRVGVLESGRRLPDEEIPETNWDINKFVWMPEAEMYGLQRIEYLDNVMVICGAGVGGGSHVYANVLYVPPRKFFESPDWAGITDWADELAPYIDQASRMLGVMRIPYMDTQVDRLMKDVAGEMGRRETFNKAPVGVYFGTPGVEADDPYFGGVGPHRVGCISCGNCINGCGRNSKNKLTVNYLYLAEKFGAVIHELNEVHEIKPIEGGGFEVHARHPGWMQRALHQHRHRYTAEQVIISAHAYGSSKLLHNLKHTGTLSELSDQLGQKARTNSEQLLSITQPYNEWKENPNRIHITPGSVSITSSVWPDEETCIQPVYYGAGSNLMGFSMTSHLEGAQKHPGLDWLKELIEHPSQVLNKIDVRHWSERQVVLLCMQTTDTSIELYWKDGMLRSRIGNGTPPSVHIPIVEDFADRIARKMNAEQGSSWFEVLNKTTTAHFIGGIPIGENAGKGVLDPYQRVFGYPGLHVMDGSVMPANPGVNPSLMITALAERAISFWPNKGEEDLRPSLGSGYKRIKAVMPHKPVVPPGSPGELRLDAKMEDIIPDYAY